MWLVPYMAAGVVFGVWDTVVFLRRAEVIALSRGEAVVIAAMHAAVCSFLWPLFAIRSLFSGR